MRSGKFKEDFMRKILLGIIGLALFAMPVSAQTAEEIIAKYIKTIGGAEKIEAIKTLRRTGKYTGGGGFEAVLVHEKKRPEMARMEFSIQGMTGITAYDGKTGWKIEPWQGKKDAEALGEEEMKEIQEEADFDGPLVDYQRKGNKIEFVGPEPVEGTDAFKLKVTLKNGDVRYYFMDTDYYVPIKIEAKRMVRGAEREFETSLGDYKEVAGVYLPHSIESSLKGSPNKSQITFEKIEANVALDDSRFKQPTSPAKPVKPEGGKSE
jgi:outer membrane lipoprotein-sorting protein